MRNSGARFRPVFEIFARIVKSFSMELYGAQSDIGSKRVEKFVYKVKVQDA